MEEERWEKLIDVAGQGEADILRGLLEAQGIPVWMSQEGAGKIFAATVGWLGRVEIMVPASYLDQAQQVLDELDEGFFEEGAFEENQEAGAEAVEEDLEDDEFDDEDFDDDEFDDDDFDDDDLDDDGE